MRALNLAVRFACEIAALVAFIWWGWPLVGWLVAVAVTIMWGLVVAPKATHRLPDPSRLLVELVIFASAIVAFYEAGGETIAGIYGVLAVASAVLVRVWPEPVV
jgi:Protein of unknown function (DUF2568)